MIIALLAAYNEEDVIAQVVGDLIAQGVQVYFIDHGSTDQTVARIEPLLGRGLLAVERFPDESGFPEADRTRYAWSHLLQRKESLAAQLDADWFIHADADELRESPWLGSTLAEAIAAVDRLGYNAIDFQVFNFCPIDDSFRPGDDLRQVFQYYELGAEHDRPQIKAWKRQPGPVDLSTKGGHQVQFADRRVFPVRFVLRHYPIRSQAHGQRKVFSERRPRFVDEERALGWHVQYDGLTPESQFVRRAEELTRWDDVAVRAWLAEHNRAVEEAGSRAAEAERGRAEAELVLERTRAQMKEYLGDRDERAGEAARLYAERSEREAAVAALREEMAALRAAHDRWAAESATLYAERAEHAAQLEHSNAEKDALRVERDRWAAQSASLYAERAERGAQLEQLNAEKDALRVERDRWAGEAAALYDERGAREAALAELAATVEGLRRELAAARAELDAARVRHAANARRLAQLDQVERALADAYARLDQFYASRTWRWAAPARLAWRLIGRQ